MTEQAPEISQTNTELAPKIAIGGVWSFKKQWPYYFPLLRDPGCELSARERFFSIPHGGKAPLDETYGELEEQFVETYERLGERPLVVGHSLGALMAMMLALEHPDKIGDVYCAAGVQEGIKRETPSSLAIRASLGHPPGEEHIEHDSDFMNEHKRRVATEWSPDSTLHLITPTYDDILLFPQGLGLELPEGQKAQKRIIAPHLPGTEFLLRRIPGMPEDVKLLQSPYAVGHVNIAISLSLLAYVSGGRRNRMIEPSETTSLATSELSALPLAA